MGDARRLIKIDCNSASGSSEIWEKCPELYLKEKLFIENLPCFAVRVFRSRVIFNSRVFLFLEVLKFLELYNDKLLPINYYQQTITAGFNVMLKIARVSLRDFKIGYLLHFLPLNLSYS